MSETQLNSTEVSLQPWVEDALVNLHARKKVPMNSNFTPWTIEEDRLLLHSYQNGAKITDIRVSSRSAEAIKLQLRRLQNVTPLVRDAHYKSRCDPEAPFQYLQHGIWTPIVHVVLIFCRTFRGCPGFQLFPGYGMVRSRMPAQDHTPPPAGRPAWGYGRASLGRAGPYPLPLWAETLPYHTPEEVGTQSMRDEDYPPRSRPRRWRVLARVAAAQDP